MGVRAHEVEAAAPPVGTPRRSRLRAHLDICRVDHWFKNVFVLPVILIAAVGVVWYLSSRRTRRAPADQPVEV